MNESDRVGYIGMAGEGGRRRERMGWMDAGERERETGYF